MKGKPVSAWMFSLLFLVVWQFDLLVADGG